MIKVTRKNLQPITRRNIRNTDGVIALCLVFIQEYCMNIQVIFRLSAVQQRTVFIFFEKVNTLLDKALFCLRASTVL